MQIALTFRNNPWNVKRRVLHNPGLGVYYLYGRRFLGGADLWRVGEGERKNGVRLLSCSPPTYNKKADYPGPFQANREGGRNGAAGCDFFPSSLNSYVLGIFRGA